MIRNVFWLLIFVLFFSCSPLHEISSKDASFLINSHDIVIVDIRSSINFRDGHIKGAFSIPYNCSNIQQRLTKFKNNTILFYCETGLKTDKLSPLFKKIGFSKIYILSGGISSWKKAGFSLEKL